MTIKGTAHANFPVTDILNVASWEARSIVNGPGERFVLWLQGCPFRCAECFNQEYLPFVPRELMTVDELAQRILAIDGNEGITYSGGEPMAQARGLSKLSEMLRSHGLSVVCYTGFTLAELHAKHDLATERFLRAIDVLIDGRFEREQQALLPWRGSKNQNVHFLTSRYEQYAKAIDARTNECEVELIVNSGGYTATGIIDLELLKQLDCELDRGVP